MQFTLKRKIIIGLVAIVTIGVISMLIVNVGLLRLRRMMHVLADVEAPTVSVAYELEINVWGYGMAVLRYLDGRDPLARARAAKDKADYLRFHRDYARLGKTDEARAYARRLAEDFEHLTRLGGDMMARRDHEEDLLIATMTSLERIDALIDRHLQPRVDRSDPTALRSLEALLDMEAELAEFGLWVANYRRTHEQHDLDLAGHKREEFEAALAAFGQNVAAGSIQRQALTELQQAFDEGIAALAEAQAIAEELTRDSEAFRAVCERMDDLIDDQVQRAALGDLAVPRIDADRLTRSVVRVATILVPFFVLATAAVGFVLIRSVMRPLQRLIRSTAVVRHGDLGHRVACDGRDELSDLGREFNRMVAELQATTVSKTSLERSEARLREVNAELLAEIDERERAQQEQSRLQMALKRSELLSAMGSLVAGVAHEVRNPLFGISSTVDALHVRLQHAGLDADYAGHVQVLRGELERLRKLMQDLLDYGKRSAIELVESPVTEAVEASVRACAPAAARQKVIMTTRIEPGADVWTMDRARIEQVLQNLLENAIQHSPPGGRVCLDVNRAAVDGSACLRVQVRDTGHGFDPAQLSRVFEPFFTRRNGGTGLGLAIVARIVEAHRGTVRAANRRGGGAELTVELPEAVVIPREDVAHAAQRPADR